MTTLRPLAMALSMLLSAGLSALYTGLAALLSVEPGTVAGAVTARARTSGLGAVAPPFGVVPAFGAVPAAAPLTGAAPPFGVPAAGAAPLAGVLPSGPGLPSAGAS